jgi:hypothetical protein
MDTIIRNNIFLDAWEDTLLETFLKQDSCGMVTHFISNIMNNLYPGNNSFNTFDDVSEDFSEKLSSNNTLLENIFSRYWGTYLYEYEDQDTYFSSDIKCGDIFFLNHEGLPWDYVPKISLHLYTGNGYFFNWNMGEQEPIEHVKKSTIGAKLEWVLRYNFDRTDTKTPSGADDIKTWEDFWGESYVSMNNLSYNKNHRVFPRELVASIDTDGTITTDIEPVPALSEFVKIFLLKDCLCCFKEFERKIEEGTESMQYVFGKENEYSKNGEYLPSYPATAGAGYFRYNWTLEFDQNKYTDIENYLKDNNLQYKVI